MQLPICGPSYSLPAIDINNQRCINYYPTSSGPQGRGTTNLSLCYGLSLLIDCTGLETRCLGVVGDYIYAVVDEKVYQITINSLTQTADKTQIGTMSSFSGVVKMAANPTQIVWVDGSTTGYIYTIATNTFAAINSYDADFPGGSDVKFINSYFVVSKPNTGKFYSSAENDGTSWNALDVATAETSTDNILSLGVYKGELWIFGTDSIEIWYDAANASGSPFSPRTGLQIQVGCGAANSVVSMGDLLIWLDSRGFIVQSSVSSFLRSNNSGYDLKPISTDAMTSEILGYSAITDAIAMGYNYRGHLMYQITFPTAKKTWVYDFNTESWHEREYHNPYTQLNEHHLCQFYARYNSLHVMAGQRNGKIYVASENYYSDAGDTIFRKRVTPLIYDSDKHNLSGINELNLRLWSGDVAQGATPQISLRYSNDSGHTWSNFIDRDIGAVGEYGKVITWNRLGTAREWVFEFSTSTTSKHALIDATINFDMEK